jgi:siroheme synthase (precorrin-2 oxidase/ferrochelatase)
MSNKKQTLVSWLKNSIEDLIANDIGSQVKFKNKVIHALEMEAKKQQKYDEMLAMLVKSNPLHEGYHFTKLKAYQLVKEAKELCKSTQSLQH